MFPSSHPFILNTLYLRTYYSKCGVGYFFILFLFFPYLKLYLRVMCIYSVFICYFEKTTIKMNCIFARFKIVIIINVFEKYCSIIGD